jgi:hypothetical protein
MATYTIIHTKTVPTAKWFHELDSDSAKACNLLTTFMKFHFGAENVNMLVTDSTITTTVSNITQQDVDDFNAYVETSNARNRSQLLIKATDGYNLYNAVNGITTTVEVV